MNALFTADTISASDGEIKTDVLIIGAGLAGLSTALALPKSLNITILSKAALDTCSSHYAQGGIAASLAKEDTISDHVADTLSAGAGLCASDNTTTILSAGQQAVQWLCAQGVPFTQIAPQNLTGKPTASAELTIADLHLTKEGGHGCRRVAHADDATGRHVMQALMIKTNAAANITILPYHEALTLLTTPLTALPLITSPENKYCQGALVFDHNTQRQLTFRSRAVVLASGGLGQLFQRASAPNVCVGDGVMMAWQAGCRLANLEFIQFHPTGLALGSSNFLISEALRGEGGHLYCPKTNARFMLDIDERAELAPRDIVARAIAEQSHSNGLGYVHLDVSHLPADFLRQHFPQIYQKLLNLGIDITKAPIPVAPTAHYSCGGVVTCANGLTDVPGLYAAGEVAYTGLHGANRLASNSLLECVVVGRHIAAHLPNYLAALSQTSAQSFTDKLTPLPSGVWTLPKLSAQQQVTLPLPTLSLPILPLHNVMAAHNDNGKNHTDIKTDKDSYSVDDVDAIDGITAQLKALMTNNMGIMRSAEQLEQALQQIQSWQLAGQQYYSSYPKRSPDLAGLNNANHSMTRKDLARFRLARQLQLAMLIVQSAYQRCESRGGHYRKDYPHLASKPQISVIAPLAVSLNSQLDSSDKSIVRVQSHLQESRQWRAASSTS